MIRGILLIVIALAIFVAPPAAITEQQKTPPRIGFLLMGSPQAGLTSAFDAFREGLREFAGLRTRTSPSNTDGRGES